MTNSKLTPFFGLVSLLLGASPSSILAISSTYSSKTYVYTPNGTSVLVYSYDELEEETIDDYNTKYDRDYPEATRIASASAHYNCHSYAWYMQSSSNPYWMPDPANYYEDGSYIESTGKVGDIIIYYTSVGKVWHSGVIIDVLEGESTALCVNSDLYMVRSKWTYAGLYEHRGDYCPYTLDCKNFASYVKLYTLAHAHSYTSSYTWASYTMHTAYCTCGASTTQGHAVSSNAYSGGKQYATCLLCGGDAEIGFTQLSINSTEITQVTDNGSFILPNGVVVLVDEDIDAYLNGTLQFHNKSDAAIA